MKTILKKKKKCSPYSPGYKLVRRTDKQVKNEKGRLVLEVRSIEKSWGKTKGHCSQWCVGEHKVSPRRWSLKHKKESSRERRGRRASLQRESRSYKGFTMAESSKTSVTRSAIGGVGMSGHPEWWQMGRCHWQRAFHITLKVGFYPDTYGEPLKDLNLKGEVI